MLWKLHNHVFPIVKERPDILFKKPPALQEVRGGVYGVHFQQMVYKSKLFRNIRTYLISSFSSGCVWVEGGFRRRRGWQKAFLTKMNGDDPDFDLGSAKIFQLPTSSLPTHTGKLNVFDKLKSWCGWRQSLGAWCWIVVKGLLDSVMDL